MLAGRLTCAAWIHLSDPFQFSLRSVRKIHHILFFLFYWTAVWVTDCSTALSSFPTSLAACLTLWSESTHAGSQLLVKVWLQVWQKMKRKRSWTVGGGGMTQTGHIAGGSGSLSSCADRWPLTSPSMRIQILCCNLLLCQTILWTEYFLEKRHSYTSTLNSETLQWIKPTEVC